MVAGISPPSPIANLAKRIESLEKEIKDLNEGIIFTHKWIERLIWDDDLSYEECVSILKHNPWAPWNKLDKGYEWDVSHKDYGDKMMKEIE